MLNSRIRALMAAAIVASLSACTGTRSDRRAIASATLSTPAAWPSGAVFEPAPPATMQLDVSPRSVTPDGEARWLVRVRLRDAFGRPTFLVHGGNIDFTASRGRTQWQTRLRFGGPAALVTSTSTAPLAVTARIVDPSKFSKVRAAVIIPDAGPPSFTASALGPYVVQLGWFPPSSRGTVRIVRFGGQAAPQIALVAAPGTSYRDTSVRPGQLYRYRIALPGDARSRTAQLVVPSAPRHETLAALGGKSVWLSFSPDERDPDAFDRLDPAAIVAGAAGAGLRALELRTAYGGFWEITPPARPRIDALLDAAAAHHIAVIGWTVPRAASFDDLALAVATTAYRTPNGHGFAALAVDVERGDGYFGNGAAGRAAIIDYVHRLRQALGPRYPLIATVEDPNLEHLGERDYPYAEIAANVDALQTMSYWRMMSSRAVTPRAVAAALAASYAAARRLAHRPIPVVIGAQTSSEGPRGAPPPGEITAAIDTAQHLGALGITFFDWRATTEPQWQSIAERTWRCCGGANARREAQSYRRSFPRRRART